MTASQKAPTQKLRNISAVAVTVSVVVLVLAIVWSFSPHVSHRLFAFFTNSSTPTDIMFYDGTTAAELPSSTPATTALPDTGGCGCPSCCAVPAS